MIILPAIDIKDGRCVRLYQGNYDKQTTYSVEPVQVALRWQAAGASWLHVVDLDGAASGELVNLEVIKQLRKATTIKIEVGGGLRSLASIERVLDIGIERIILGTAALKDRQLLAGALQRWSERIAVGLDARDGRVATSGWRETSNTRATELAKELGALGVRRFIYTDIARDGALNGPNIEALKEVQQAITGDEASNQQKRALIASGGIRSLADLRSLAALHIEGAIVGKAIYTGDVDLAAAIGEIEKE